MTITRTAFIAIPNAETQEKAVVGFKAFAAECKKNGAPYIVSSKAAKCKVVVDMPGSSKWTVMYQLTFASEEDMKYYETEDPVYQDAMKQAGDGSSEGIISVVAEL